MEDVILLNPKEVEVRAATDSGARLELRQLMLDTLIQQAHMLIKRRGLSESREGELIDIGMSAFDHAFEVYLKNGSVFNEGSNFAPYFAWWARQAMVAHLEK